jgi:hypothetical protein
MLRLPPLRRTRALLGISLAFALVPANAPSAQQSTTQQNEIRLTNERVAKQLGTRVQDRPDGTLSLGSSFTGMLEEPEKLEAFGIRGMHKGARVVVMRVAPDRIRVEADELEPTEVRGAATIRVDPTGDLIAPRKP